MKALSRFIVKIADLAEAEGRVLRREVVSIGFLLVVALGAVLMGLGGAAMLVVAVFLALQPAVGAAWAAAISGVLLLAGAGGLVWLVKRMHSR